MTTCSTCIHFSRGLNSESGFIGPMFKCKARRVDGKAVYVYADKEAKECKKYKEDNAIQPL